MTITDELHRSTRWGESMMRHVMIITFVDKLHRRGRLAIWRTQNTIDTARHHAFQIIWLEQHLGLFFERQVQRFFLSSNTAMWFVNRIYSYVHLPATVSFLVLLYWYAITCERDRQATVLRETGRLKDTIDREAAQARFELYEGKRRALALSNLMAFMVFSTWPCMPPRLLAEDNSDSNDEISRLQIAIGKSFDFVDTTHGRNGAISIWYVVVGTEVV
jgi:hypothetical protein